MHISNNSTTAAPSSTRHSDLLVTAPRDSYSGNQCNVFADTFENVATALSDSYGTYIPDPQPIKPPADIYSGYYCDSDAI